MGRVGSWLAGPTSCRSSPTSSPWERGSAQGTRRSVAVLCRRSTCSTPCDQGSREFDLGHTWDGAPGLSTAVGLSVLEPAGVRAELGGPGPGTRTGPAGRVGGCARGGLEVVREVRGRGLLLGVELVDPRDGESFLPVELDGRVARRRRGVRARAPRHVDPPAGRRLRGRTRRSSPPRRDDGRGARRDRRSLPGHDRGRGGADQGLLVGAGANGPMSPRAKSSCSSGIPRRRRLRSAGRRCGPDAFEWARARDRDDGPHPRAGPGGHADRRLRAFRDPIGRRGSGSCIPTRTPCTTCPGDPAGALLAHPQLARRLPLRVRPARGLPSRWSRTSASLGYEVMSAIEYEIRLWDPQGSPMSSGISYSLVEIGGYDRLIDELVRERSGGSGGRAVCRCTRRRARVCSSSTSNPAGGLAAADDAALVKFGVKQVRRPRWVCARASWQRPCPERRDRADTSTCRAGRARRMRSPARILPTRLPPVGRGRRRCARAPPRASLLMNPTVNSYKRLVPGWFAPINATVGLREPLLRRARRSDSARPELWRLECRRPGADANPYLALAAHRRLRRRRHPARGADATGAHRGRCLCTFRPAGACRGPSRAAIRAFEEDQVLREGPRDPLQRVLRDVPGLGAQSLARDGHGLGTRALRAGRGRPP